MIRRIIILGLSTLFSLGLIFTLHKICIAQNLKIGNFNRKFEFKNLKKINEINLPIETYNFAGFNNNNIFLTSKKLTEIVKYDLTTKKL